jgi:hypothetical protein
MLSDVPGVGKVGDLVYDGPGLVTVRYFVTVADWNGGVGLGSERRIVVVVVL